MSAKHTPRLHEQNKLKFSTALVQAGFTADSISSFVQAVNGYDLLKELVEVFQAMADIKSETNEKLKADNTVLLEALKEARPYVTFQDHPIAHETVKRIDKVIARFESEVNR